MPWPSVLRMAAWERHLSWLLEEDHTTTASEFSRLAAYCRDHPRNVEKKNKHGRSPLHLAAGHQRGEYGVAVVDTLIAAYPQTLEESTKQGNLPLHAAAACQRGEHGLPIVSALLTAFPAAIRRKGSVGLLPLHAAAGSQEGEFAVAIVRTLLIAYPHALQLVDDDGCLPLHYAADYQGEKQAEDRLAVVTVLIEAYPAAAQHKNKYGCLPLHLAANQDRMEQVVAVVSALLMVCPEGAQEMDNDGWLPLHYAAAPKGDGAFGLLVIEVLLAAFPKAAEQKIATGHLPLHLAVLNKSTHRLAAVAALLEVYPEGARQRDVQGFLPLDLVVRMEQEDDAAVVTALLEAFPQAAEQKDDYGYLPLHVAADREQHAVGVVTALLETFPRGAQQKDTSAMRPLHRAARFNHGSDAPALVAALLAVNPLAARQKEEGGLLPLHLAAKYQKGEVAAEMVATLLEVYPQAAQLRDDEGWLPLHCAAKHQEGQGEGLAVVTALLEAYPQGVYQKTNAGFRPHFYADKFFSLAMDVRTLLLKAEKGKWLPRAATAPPDETATSRMAEEPPMQPQQMPLALSMEASGSAASAAPPPRPGAPTAASPDATGEPSSPAFPSYTNGQLSNISVQPIGTGTHKTVYSAIFTGPTTAALATGDSVALLCFKDNVLPNLEEFRVMTLIRAPNLAKFYGTVQPTTSDTRLRLVSDFAPLGNLPRFFEHAEDNELSISLSHKLVMARQTGDGLSALHAHHLVHADVAARNVLVYIFDPDNHHRVHVKLSDYGMVRERSKYTDVSASVAAGAAAGQSLPLSPKWASWESLNKDKFYCASDVWSFAVLAWEILTECNEPYPGVPHTVPAMIQHLSAGNRLAQPTDCDDAVWAILWQCWQEKRKDRPNLQDVLAQIALGLEHVAIATSAAQLTATEAKVQAMEAAQQAWLKVGFGWRAGDIDLCADLDKELTYAPHGNVARADLRAVGAGPLGDRLADAIEHLVVAQGGRQGGQFKANVDKITLCKNQSLITSFNERLARLHDQRLANQGTALFNGRWDEPTLSEADLADRQAVFDRLDRLFVNTDVGSGPGAKVALMWHGVSCDAVADAICATGLSSRVTKEDEGYFGKGVYLTPEPEYAAFYANQQQKPERGETYTLLLCAVCIANAYPVTRSVDYDESDGACNDPISKFHYNYGAEGTAKALYKGFDAHFVAVNTKEEWQAATDVKDADYHELVVGSEDQVLPFAKVVVKIK